MIILDLETTGLDPLRHEIIEIGAVNVDTGATFEVKIYPLRIKDAEPEALAVNGYRPEAWEDALLLPNALKLLSEFVGKKQPTMMAYNVSFDRAFLEKAHKDCDLPYPFHYHHFDLLTLAWFKLGKAMSLRNTCLALEIEPEADVHRALAGALSAKNVYEKLRNRSNA